MVYDFSQVPDVAKIFLFLAIHIFSEDMKKMTEAMEYITSKVPCIKFEPANSTSINYVTITSGKSSQPNKII